MFLLNKKNSLENIFQLKSPKKMFLLNKKGSRIFFKSFFNKISEIFFNKKSRNLLFFE